MLDIRYHIVSICAVFMMLGVGIMIGINVAAPAQIKQQTKALANLRQQVDGAVQDGREAKRRLASLQQAVDVLRLRLVPGRLLGKRVEIIQCGDYPQASKIAADAVADAGGSVVATIDITDRFVEMQPEDREALLQKLAAPNAAGTGQPVDTSTGGLINPFMADLQSGSSADTTGLISALEAERDVTITGDTSQPCALFLLVGGRNADSILPPQQVEDMETELINGLLNSGMTVSVVGCESIDAFNSSIPSYQKEGIATIDCIDQPLGELDLPFALNGEKADYGLKSTAVRELPASLEEVHP
jgi:hypothetical protein